MILTTAEAFEALRTEENGGNLTIVTGLIEAIPSYIETNTGITDADGAAQRFPLVKTLAKFLLNLWYNPDGTDAVQMQVVINNLLKTLKAMAKDINAAQVAE